MKVSRLFRFKSLICFFYPVLFLAVLSGTVFSQSKDVLTNNILYEKAASGKKRSVLIKTEKAEDERSVEPDFGAAPAEKQKFAPPRLLTENKAESKRKVKKSDSQNGHGWRLPRGAIEYGVEFGYAPQIALWMSGPKYYDVRGHQHLLGSLRWGRILGNGKIVTFSWAVEFVPINIAVGNEVTNPKYTGSSTVEKPTRREQTFGVGINPASFRFIFLPERRLRPQIGAGIGLVRHFNRVPTIDGTKGNVHIDFQIGGQYMISKQRALNFGYKYYHLSNVYLAQRNPGYNVNMFFIGYSVFKK